MLVWVCLFVGLDGGSGFEGGVVEGWLLGLVG